MNKSKRVLLVGGSGFIGSHVADQLSQEGYKVHILDKVQSKWINENQISLLEISWIRIY